ncbi:MAG: PPE domain-containing protein [Mycobacterium sp.]|uniref:PPE family protein, SVP subgroup n=1 Tax=Mycobacterium sp. TaxID=1785 RepID=UPI001EBD44A0|nr:PPE domain-containing protein [Mycobacterium sp.]MBV8785532.1 PPE domain-containing protein [Mycobacterium sp.]
MHFAALPPEVNSGRIYAGPGAGPMLSAAAAWDELADELHTAAASLESVIANLATVPWQGPSSASMAAAAAPQVAWLSSTAAQATQTSAQAKAAASAYESAYAMTVHPAEVAANRTQLSSLVATNLLGQNTPAIAATEVAYGDMWAQDVAAMYSYAGESQAATQVTPFTPPKQATNEGGVAAQGAASGKAASTAAGNAQSALSGGNATSAVPKALQSLTSPASGLSSSAFSEFSNPYDLVSLGSSLLGNGVGLIGLSGAAGFISNAEQKITGVTLGSPPAASAPGHAAKAPSSSRPAEKVSAEMGRSPSLGGLKVPEGWTTSAPQLRLTALESPAAGSAPPARPGAGLFGGQMPLFGGAPLMALSGRDKADSRRPGDEGGARGRQAPAAAAPHPRVEVPSGASGGRSSGAAAELREMTEVLGKLAQLRDTGALTEHEFIEQKQRLLGGQ